MRRWHASPDDDTTPYARAKAWAALIVFLILVGLAGWTDLPTP